MQILLAGSAIFGWPTLAECVAESFWFGAALVFAAMVGTFLMHLSETKHGLRPPWRNWSNAFLVLDRLTAGCAALGCLWLRWPLHAERDQHLLQLFTFGFICAAYGEASEFSPELQTMQRQFNWLYIILHFTWHWFAFYCMRIVIHDAILARNAV